MPIKRTYGGFGDACRAANALDLVGDRWSLIVVRELILGEKQFSELQSAARGITPAVLSERLKSLQAAGIVEQTDRTYVATKWGLGLEPVLQALGRWYSDGPGPRTSGGMTPDAMVIAMRTIAPLVSGDLTGPVALRLYDERVPRSRRRDYHAGVVDGALDVAPGAVDDPAATVTADATTWSAVLFGGLSVAAAEKSGGLVVTGRRSAVSRLVSVFRAPAARGVPGR